MKKDRVTLSFTVPTKLSAELKELAEKSDTTLGHIIREGVAFAIAYRKGLLKEKVAQEIAAGNLKED